MSKTTTMNIRMDEITHRRLKRFAKDVGVSASSLVNASIKQMLRQKRVTLETDLEPTPYLRKLIRQAEADYAKGKNITTLNNKDDLDKLFSLL